MLRLYGKQAQLWATNSSYRFKYIYIYTSLTISNCKFIYNGIGKFLFAFPRLFSSPVLSLYQSLFVIIKVISEFPFVQRFCKYNSIRNDVVPNCFSYILPPTWTCEQNWLLCTHQIQAHTYTSTTSLYRFRNALFHTKCVHLIIMT